MISKRKSVLSLLTSVVLALILCFGMALPAFGEGTNANDPATAALTKVFKTPINTVVPKAVFTFTFTKVGVGDATDATTRNNMPALGNNGSITVSFEAGDAATFIAGGTQYSVKQSDDFLSAINKNGSDWKAGEGIYKYTVKETSGGIVLTADPNDTEYEVYSQAEYDIEIWVEEDSNGVLFARYIVGYYKAGTPDEYYPGTPGDGKLDPTPGTEVPGTPPEIGENYSELIFTNRYWKTDGDPTDPNKHALAVKKLVTGNNPIYTTYFDFDVKVITPEVVGAASPKVYRGYVVDKDGNYVALGVGGNPNSKDGTGTAPVADYINFTSGTATSIKLKHDEKLVFFDLEVGAAVEVQEEIAANVRVKYSRTFGENIGTEFNMPAGKTGQWGFPNDLYTGEEGPHYTKSGAGANTATFTNNMGGIPPTGISVDDLPFVILIGAAIAGIVLFMMFKYRKGAEEDA